MNIDSELKKILKNQRLKLKKSQSDLAREFSKPQSYISNLETGKGIYIRLKDLEMLEKLYNVKFILKVEAHSLLTDVKDLDYTLRAFNQVSSDSIIENVVETFEIMGGKGE